MKALLLAAVLTLAAAAVQAQPVKPATLSLSATGEVRLAPDMATVSLGVVSDAPTAAEAVRQNAAAMTTVIAALGGQGVAERDVQTSSLGLNAQYLAVPNQPARLTGYQASHQLDIAVRDLTRLGPVIDALTAAGVNQIGGIGFGLTAPQAAEDEARRRAVKALQAKAALYAQALGQPLGRLASLSEGGGYAPMPPRVFAMAKMAAPTPVAAGELAVRIEVSGVYDLSP